jgi:hypothetical protein
LTPKEAHPAQHGNFAVFIEKFSVFDGKCSVHFDGRHRHSKEESAETKQSGETEENSFE